MKFLLSVILIGLLSAMTEIFLPWWSMAVVSFLVSIIMGGNGGKAFLIGFLGVSLFWLVAVLLQDLPNEHILSNRMAVLFHLPDYKWLIVITVFAGGLIGGLAAWAGALLKPQTP